MLTSDQLTDLRADVADTFWDTCVIQTYHATADSHGQMVNSPSGGSAISCGFRWKTSKDAFSVGGAGVVAEGDAELRLPIGTTITAKERVKITYLRGSALGTALIFQVIGEPRPGLTAILVDLKKAT